MSSLNHCVVAAAVPVILALNAALFPPLAQGKECNCSLSGKAAPSGASFDPANKASLAADIAGAAAGKLDSTMLLSQTLKTGAQATTLKSAAESTLIQGAANGALIEGQVEHQSGPVNVLFVIDASHSMKDKLGGSVEKMEAAKRVLQDALTRIPSDINLGLRVFGQSFANLPEIDCQSSALLVPVGQGNRRSIIEQVRQIHPYGLTPLAYALSQCEHDLRGLSGSKTLILITDGAETCGGDPCQYVRRLRQIGINMKVDIVGLGLKRERQARAQLNCIAQASGGKYYDANTAAELIESVSRSVGNAISGRIITPMKQPASNLETPPDMVPIQPAAGQ